MKAASLLLEQILASANPTTPIAAASSMWSRLRTLSSLAPLLTTQASASIATPVASQRLALSTAATNREPEPAAKPFSYSELLAKYKEKPPPREVPKLEPRPYTARSKRCGIIAIKAGMTQEWDQWGVRVPLTVLWVDECQVVQVKTAHADGSTALQLGCGIKRPKSVNKRQIGHCEAAGVPLKRKLVEFPVTEDALLPVGTPLTAAHFVAGQYVDVTGKTKGKGFQGVMKRWGFKGMPATHGVSLAHRAPGATGCRNDPGRIWKGKKLPGRHGNHRRTLHSCFVYKVDPERNLIYIRGQVPGQVGNFVMLRDAMRKRWPGRSQLPFPTRLEGQPAEPAVATWELDPYRVYQQDIGYFSEKWKGGD